MENHPIPQDVTGFQFRLIGNMTVKQFAYLAIGVVLGWIFLQLPIIFILKFPIAAFFAILGISLAFLPIEGRPMDVMIGHFIRAIFAPTQFVYAKSGGHLYVPSHGGFVPPLKKTPANDTRLSQDKKLKTYLSSLHHAPKVSLDEKEARFITSLQTIPSTPPPVASSAPTPPPPSITPTPPPATNSKQATDYRLPTTAVDHPKNSMIASVHQKVIDLEKKLQEVLTQKEELARQFLLLRNKVGEQDKKVFAPGTIVPKTPTANVKQIPKTMGKSIGLPIAPSSPNLISGIIKDPRGNALPNILIEVTDKDGNAVRAFKTNELGRFASATPLTNGTYTIKFEDPKSQNKFDTVEITIEGNILMPLEVISFDTREELRKSLFSPNTNKN